METLPHFIESSSQMSQLLANCNSAEDTLLFCAPRLGGLLNHSVMMGLDSVVTDCQPVAMDDGIQLHI